MLGLNRRLVVTVVVLVVATLGLSVTGIGGVLWRPVASLLSPWRADLAETTDASGDQGQDDEDTIRLRERLVRATAEIVDLRRRLAEYAEIARESGYQAEDVVAARARVVARSRRPGQHYIQIDIGAASSDASVRRGQAVCVGWSLVGIVVGEDAGGSLVRLLSDPASRIPVRILPPDVPIDGNPFAESERASPVDPLTDDPLSQAAPAVPESQAGDYQDPTSQGVLAGTGDPDVLDVLYVQDRDGFTVEPGASVVTAASSRPIPVGLIVGEVISAERTAASDHWTIRVQPLRRLRTVDHVLVMHGP